MNDARFNELVNRLLDGDLPVAEADELAALVRGRPELRRDLRHHLQMWELWSQQHASERSPEAFLAEVRTRLRAEREGEGFLRSLQKRLAQDADSGSPVRPVAAWHWLVGAWRSQIARIASAAAAVLIMAGILWIAAPQQAEAMTLRGEAVCPLCVLHQGQEHLPAIRVGQGVAARIYYLKLNGAVAGLQDRFCSGPTPVEATGREEPAAGRREFKADTIKFPAAEQPQPNPKSDERIIFPI